MVENNAIPNAVPVEEAMLLLATALEGRLEESDRPRLEQALLEHPNLRAAAADMALAPAEPSHDQESPLPIGLTRAAREAHARTSWPAWIAPLRLAASVAIMASAGLLGWSLGAPTTTSNGIDILEAHFGSEPVETMEALTNDVVWEEFGS
jgi:hypothetical protein